MTMAPASQHSHDQKMKSQGVAKYKDACVSACTVTVLS